MPSTRALARHLGISRNTVAFAYDSLVADGYLAPRVGDGTYVLGHAQRSRDALWERPRRWLLDPDGLLIWVTH
jgi:GntR family transcriptional regulator/MocR family aminotransferase